MYKLLCVQRSTAKAAALPSVLTNHTLISTSIMFKRKANMSTPTDQTESRIWRTHTRSPNKLQFRYTKIRPEDCLETDYSNDAASHTNKRDNISCNIQHTRRAAARKLISFTAGFTNDVFGCITFWRRNYFFFILAHSVYKIRITQEPNTFELWNKLHFEEKKTESIYHV